MSSQPTERTCDPAGVFSPAARFVDAPRPLTIPPFYRALLWTALFAGFVVGLIWWGRR